MYHVDEFDAIVDPGQMGILAVGKVVKETAVKNDAICIIPRMKISLAVDHRIADGVAAAQLLDAIRLHLESVISIT